MLLQRTQARTFNPQFIENIAAEVFWGYCFRTVYQTAINCVLTGDYGKLWTLKKAAELLHRYDPGLSKDAVKRCYSEVNEYMRDHAAMEQNILGTLYVEDFANCRPPQFGHNVILEAIQTARGGGEGEITGSPPVAGDLLIRTPLPAVLLLRGEPPGDCVQVADTRKALGFHKTMVLTVGSFSPLPPNPQGYAYSASGVFRIPCRDPEAIETVWYKLMPNSTACKQLILC
jgi:hypothetical protein